MNNDDLRWLASERPAGTLPDPATTVAARRALAAHVSTPRIAMAPPRQERARRRPVKLLAAAAVGAAVAATVAILLSVGGGTGSFSTPTAAAAPLLRLSEKVSKAPAPTGDATLVQRSHTFANGSTMTGADLYLDSGAYYYATTAAGLPEALSGQPVDDGATARELAAAVAAVTLDPEAARTRMADAIYPGGKPPVQTAPSPAVQAAIEQKKALAIASGHPLPPPSSPEVIFNNHIWANCLDTLEAGAGRSDVKAGILRLLATIPEVAVEPTTTDGEQTLTLTAHLFPGAYTEQIVIDASDGTPIRFAGGNPNETPSVVVTYKVTRVTAENLGSN
ncbi:MAG TPA: hypothetical protein VH063_12700 [Gaiellaceae bacterium]|nr:hypothetical protein [Gaiellaceae bacterium]